MADEDLRGLARAAANGDVEQQHRLHRALARSGIAVHNGIEFEVDVPEGRFIAYDRGRSALQDAGYDRHPLPAEAFGLLIDHARKPLDGPLGRIARQAQDPLGEWLSVAWEVHRDTLIAYFNPRGPLTEDRAEFVRETFCADHVEEFSIDEDLHTLPRNFIPLQNFSEDFVVAHYGIPYNELPAPLRKPRPPCAVINPYRAGTIQPVSRGSLHSRYDICNQYVDACSRGARIFDPRSTNR